MMKHEFEVTLYVEDTDYTGVVYHPNYLKYMERARLNWFEQLGFGLEQQKKDGFYYVIRHIDLHYKKPARMDERLKIRTTIKVIGRAKAQLRFHQEIDNLSQQESSITEADILVVCVNHDIRPIPVPNKILEKLDD